MIDDVRKNATAVVEAAVSAVTGALTPSRAREVARSVTGGEGSKQVNRVAQELLERSRRSREWITDAIAREVKRQLSAMGVATREDFDALRKRVRELERATGTSSRAKKSTAKKSTAKRATAKTSSPAPDPTPPSPAEGATGLGDPGPTSP